METLLGVVSIAGEGPVAGFVLEPGEILESSRRLRTLPPALDGSTGLD